MFFVLKTWFVAWQVFGVLFLRCLTCFVGSLQSSCSKIQQPEAHKRMNATADQEIALMQKWVDLRESLMRCRGPRERERCSSQSASYLSEVLNPRTSCESRQPDFTRLNANVFTPFVQVRCFGKKLLAACDGALAEEFTRCLRIVEEQHKAGSLNLSCLFMST